MRMKIEVVVVLAVTFALMGTTLKAQRSVTDSSARPPRPLGPCDVYAAAGDPCVAAHSTTRALYASYVGALYEVVRQSDGKALNIGVVQPVSLPFPDAGGYADAGAQDTFCANTACWITRIYDQSGKGNDLTQAPRGGFSGPAMGGFNNVPVADMAPVTIMGGHKVYGVFIEPGMGLRTDDPKGTAVDDQAEGQYWVINGLHFNSGCCFDYGNAEIDSRDDDNGTMETTYFGDAPYWFHGDAPGPWIMTDQENNLVGCVNADGSKICKLPDITWRFVTAMAKGEPHHWTSMGGDAQAGPLQVMFSGPRVNGTYDPMRKQGAILLGNGGDNSNGSQGTFYEGAVTAAGTFPTDATDQQVQANIVAAGYGELPVSVKPASETAAPPGLQIFSPGSSQETTVTFTNTTGAPAAGVTLSLQPPAKWSAVIAGTSETSKRFDGPVALGASVSATFQVTSGLAALNGDLIGKAVWKSQSSGREQRATIAEKVRSVSPVKINEFRISSGPPTNETNSFIELYNAGDSSVDLSNWTLTEHPTQQAIFSSVKIPAGTRLQAHSFYLFGLSNSGLATEARAGDRTLFVRNAVGMKVGDPVTIGFGSTAESRTITSVGTAAANSTTLWQPLPDGPALTIPAGSKNVPVMSASGFVVGQKVALGHGGTYPTVTSGREEYEVATVTAVGKPGTQAYLAADASAGATNIKVTSVSAISVGDRIRLDIDSLQHGIETVTVTRVGTEGTHTNLAAEAPAGATNIKVRRVSGISAGNKITVGTPANQQEVTVTKVGTAGPHGTGIEFTPALAQAHIGDEGVVEPGTGLDLAAPLKFNHAANLPFSDRGTGISFEPVTAFAHISNEPVQALGTGIGVDKPLAMGHEINSVVRDAAVSAAGYQGTPAPSQWFGGPELTTNSPLFGRTITVREGSMVLRDASGLVVDSLNYGGLVDPWAAEGYQAVSGMGKSGCFVAAPGPAGFGPIATAAANTSAGRFPDGRDTASNCADFVTAPATALAAAAASGTTNIKVSSVEGFGAGEAIRIDSGTNLETGVIAKVGTAGATTVGNATAAGATVLQVGTTAGFNDGQSITVGSGPELEAAVVAFVTRWDDTITLAAPLAHTHAAGTEVVGSGITLAAPLTRAHSREAQVTGSISTPSAPNQYSRKLSDPPAAGLRPPQISPEEKARNEAAYAAYLKAPDTDGTGPYPATKEEDPGLPDHVVYRPKDLSKVGRGQLGLIGWGNGACAADGAGSRFELAEIASHGYIVVAPGGIHSGPGSTPAPPSPPPPPGGPRFRMATSTADVKAGIDWALAENARPGSSYFGKIDPAKVGVAGFSCGGIHALELASDVRVKALIMQNSGMFPDDSKIFEGLKVNKATLQTLRVPVLYILGGPTDIAYENGMDDFKRINQVPVMVASNNAGHGGDFIKPNGGPSALVAAKWFDWQLRADKEAEKYFVGSDCGICKEPEWKVDRKNFATAP